MEKIRKIKSLFSKIKWTFNDFLYVFGFNSIWSKPKSGLRILVYHGIDKKGRLDINGRYISEKRFEEHLVFFKKHFQFISLDDAYSGNYDSTQFNLVLTFDDGYKNNIELGLPLLIKHQLPATFFITTIQVLGHDFLWPDLLDIASLYLSENLVIEEKVYKKVNKEYQNSEGTKLKRIAKQKDWKFKTEMINEIVSKFDINQCDLQEYWKLLTHDNIRVMASSPLITIGSHGVSHNNLGLINFEDACKEISNSKKYLEQIIGKTIHQIAFPDGSYSKELIEYCHSIGLNQQLACDFIFDNEKNNTIVKERFIINPYISVRNQATSIIKGNY